MKTIVKIIIFISITLFFNSQTMLSQCNIDDWSALKALYQSTDGDNWTNSSRWDIVLGNELPANCNLNNLYGISTDDKGRVERLSLNGNQLRGILPTEIGNLSNLLELELSSNYLTGSIPPEIGNLNNLVYLNLHSNQLSGEIPIQFGKLSKLNVLYLNENKLEGGIPSELCNLHTISILQLNNNNLDGCYPECMNSFSGLLIVDDNFDIVDVIQMKQTKEGNGIFTISSLNLAVYCFLCLIIICLLLYIFNKPVRKTELKKGRMSYDIDKLILKDKIENALEKLHACVRHNDEKLRSEILFLSNSLYSCNRDRLNGLMKEEDYSIRKNKIVTRTIDINSELQLA